MESEPLPPTAVVTFDSAAEADRRIAGVTAAGRIVRALGEAGFAEVWLAIPQGEAVGGRTLDDVRRLAGAIAVRVGEPLPGQPAARFAGNRLPALGNPDVALVLDQPGAAAEILRRTGKPTDGWVSRWLNRPLSRILSGLLLQLPGIRPMHATLGTALLALAMFAVLVAGGPWSLAVGGLLFQGASVFDGVDGEVARATFRTSPLGAALDTTVDVATSLLLVIGVAFNLWEKGEGEAVVLASWGLSVFVIGLALIGWHARRTGGPFSFNRIKVLYRRRASGPIVAAFIAFATSVTSRDFFALLFAVLLVAGWPMAVLYLFAAAASVWILFVGGSVLASPRVGLSPENA